MNYDAWKTPDPEDWLHGEEEQEEVVDTDFGFRDTNTGRFISGTENYRRYLEKVK